MSTPKWISEMEAIAKAATPGEWERETDTRLIWAKRTDWEPGMFTSPNNRVVCEVEHPAKRSWDNGNEIEFEGNLAHIAANSPERILALLKLVKEMGEALKYERPVQLEDAWMKYQRGPVEVEK